MNIVLRAMVFTIGILFAGCSSLITNARAASSTNSCSQPVVMKLTTADNGGTKYEISGKASTGYPLDELRRLLSDCKVSKPLYVVIDSRIPIGQIASAVAPKLQAGNVRYFIQYPESEHMVVEVKIGDYLSKLP